MPDEELKARLLRAALDHVPFDGWSQPSFDAAVADCGAEPALVRSLFPRGALDLAVLYHKTGDREMETRLAHTELRQMRVRERVAFAVRTRIEAARDKEAVRRGTTLFAMPQNAVEGARLIWGTADAIWHALGDPSDDFNWYSKRAILSGVYSSTVLYWLGDESPGDQATWAFLDRRIEDVMRFEEVKARVQDNPALKPFLAGPNWVLSQIKPPRARRDDLAGTWGRGGT